MKKGTGYAPRVAIAAQRTRNWITTGALLAISSVVGLFAAAKVDGVGPLSKSPFNLVTTLPLTVVLLLLPLILLAVLSVRVWWVGLAAFLAWLPFEDLVRKFAGNDLRVYLMKDVLLLIAFVGVAPNLAGCWRRMLGPAWKWLSLVLVIAAVQGIHSAMTDIRLPVIGIVVPFVFVLLFPIGAWLAQDAARLRTLFVLLCALSSLICAIGLLQTVLGSGFLNPSVVDKNLSNLIVIRGDTGSLVVRPSGPFVDTGRFASMTTVTLVFGICLLRLAATKRERLLAGSTSIIAVAAAFASGGRTALVFAGTLGLFGVLFSGTSAQTRRRVVVVTCIFAVGALVATSGSLAVLSENRVEFYNQTLNPTSERSDLVPRAKYYWSEAAKGIRFGGVIGSGTGTQVAGKQYLGDSAPVSVAESGWGVIAAEWGFFGLLAWVGFTMSWVARAVRASRHAIENSPARPITPVVALFIVLTLVVLFTLGAQTFQNYITNTFFWLLSGMAFSALVPRVQDSVGAYSQLSTVALAE